MSISLRTKSKKKFSLLHQQGNHAFIQGKYQQAIQFYQQALTQDPNNHLLHYNLANTYLHLNRLNSAQKEFQQALTLKPHMIDAYNNLGLIANRQKQYKKAVQLFRKALKIQPDHIYLLYNLAKTFQLAGRPSQAIKYLKQAIRFHPSFANAYNDLGTIYSHHHDYHQALPYFHQATSRDPNFALAFYNLGLTYKNLGDYQKAYYFVSQALGKNPKLSLAHNELGKLLLRFGHYRLARSHFKKALRFDSQLPDAAYNLGICYQEQGKLDQARVQYQKTLALAPRHSASLTSLYRLALDQCFFNSQKNLGARVAELTRFALKHHLPVTENPLYNLVRSQNPNLNLQVARAWMLSLTSAVQETPNRQLGHLLASSTLNLGYLSSNFRNQATSHLLSSLFSIHNRHLFRINVFSYSASDLSNYQQHLKKQADAFFDIQSTSAQESVSLIRQLPTHILLDLKGLQGDSRPEILAAHPAPVQIHWIGLPGSTGADYLHYFLADPIVAPLSFQSFFTEKLLHLPHTYLPASSDKSSSISTRILPQLSSKTFIFASFNQSYKLSFNLLQVWIKLLHAYPDSVLLYLEENTTTQKNITASLRQASLSPNRIIFVPSLPKSQHLARIRQTSLVLDTTRVNGHTTTVDTLQAGVPLVTLAGGHFASRVSASLLSALGLSELITHSLDDYYHLALYLATHPEKLNALKSKIASHKSTSLYPLFDTHRFTRNLEAAYLAVWDNYLTSNSPQAFAITDPKPLIANKA